jgi:hypothetical protein
MGIMRSLDYLVWFGLFGLLVAPTAWAENNQVEESRSPLDSRSPLAPLDKGGSRMKVPLDKGSRMEVPLDKWDFKTLYAFHQIKYFSAIALSSFLVRVFEDNAIALGKLLKN